MMRVFACFLLGSTLAVAQIINPATRTITTDNFLLTWNTGADTEAITTLDWMGGSNVTSATGLGTCGNTGEGGNVEYFGNGWGPPDPQDGGEVLVGSGTSTPPGTLPWFGQTLFFGTPQITINSSSTTCLPTSAAINVQTTYRFPGPDDSDVNWFRVQRVFDFTNTAFVHDLRPYIPRLSLPSGYTEVLYPGSDGTLAYISAVDCGEGCTGPVGAPGASLLSPSWDSERGWFAIHNLVTQQGVVIKRVGFTDPQGNNVAAQLWVDNDSAAIGTNASSVLLLNPTGGFTGGLVSETETLCFYNSTTWTPSLIPPVGCRDASIRISPSTLVFATQEMGTASPPETATVTNTGNNSVAIAPILASGDFVQTNTCPEMLPAGESCGITVSFEPTQSGIRSGFVYVHVPGNSQHLGLAGLGGQ